MASSEGNQPYTSNQGGDNLQIEQGERVALSPDSRRFAHAFSQTRPRTAREVRDLIGVSDDMGASLRDVDASYDLPLDYSAIVPAEQLDSPDDDERARARDATDSALRSYVNRANPAGMVQMEPAMTRYLEVVDLVVNTVTLQDIEVADGGTLTIPSDTHLVEANKIILHGTARIDCSGFTKFNVASIEAR